MAGRRVRSLGYSCRAGQSAETALLTHSGPAATKNVAAQQRLVDYRASDHSALIIASRMARPAANFLPFILLYFDDHLDFDRKVRRNASYAYGRSWMLAYLLAEDVDVQI